MVEEEAVATSAEWSSPFLAAITLLVIALLWVCATNWRVERARRFLIFTETEKLLERMGEMLSQLETNLHQGEVDRMLFSRFDEERQQLLNKIKGWDHDDEEGNGKSKCA